MVIDAVAGAVFTILLSAAPPLLIGLTVGLTVSIFQTVTSIQEQTLSFVPKIMATMISLIFFGPFILNNIVTFFQTMVMNMQYFVMPM